MKRYRITNNELAEKLGRLPGSISRLRRSEQLPAVGGEEIDRLAIAMTEILRDRGIEHEIKSKDLISFD
jgi:hypothetical protein